MSDQSETPQTDAVKIQVVELRHDGDRHFNAVRVDFARSLETALTESQLKLEGAERWNGIYQGEIAALKAECERLREQVYVPGVWKCGKCKLELMTSILAVSSASLHADNRPQECPNKCGPMWRITERDQRKEAQKLHEKEFLRATEQKQEIERLRKQLAAKERDRHYHMDAINRLASFLALSGTSFEVIQAATDNMTRMAGECQRLRAQCQEEIRLRSEAVERTVAAENREREAFRRAEAICQQEGDEWASDAQITDKNYAHACRDRIAGIADERRIDAAIAEEER